VRRCFAGFIERAYGLGQRVVTGYPVAGGNEAPVFAGRQGDSERARRLPDPAVGYLVGATAEVLEQVGEFVLAREHGGGDTDGKQAHGPAAVRFEVAFRSSLPALLQ